jgi:tetratricopeptide (TPR) repeat protein
MEPGPRAKGAHVRALAQGVVLLVRGGLVALAERLFASARRIVTDVPFGEPTVRAWVDQAGAEMALHAGDPTTFLALIESAIEGFAEAGDTRNAALQRAGVGAAYLQLGAFARAERVLRQAIAIAEPMRLAFVAPARASLGATLARLGHLDEALAIEADAVERCVAQGYRRVEAIARVHLADVHVRRGALAEADAELRRAEAAASGLPAVRAHALAAHAECALAGDARADRALAYATEAMEILAARGGVDEAEARIRLAHVRALEASGRTQEAGVALAAAAARLRERAARIGDPRYRRAFLHDVPENAATLARGGVVDPPGSGLV